VKKHYEWVSALATVIIASH